MELQGAKTATTALVGEGKEEAESESKAAAAAAPVEASGEASKEGEATGAPAEGAAAGGAPPREPLTPRKVVQDYLSSPSFLFLMLPALFMFKGSGGEGGGAEEGVMLLTFVVGGIIASAFLVSKLENSTWRQNLRQECEELERKQGIAHTKVDKQNMATNMGLNG